MFEIEIRSCPNSRQILAFLPCKILGVRAPKFVNFGIFIVRNCWADLWPGEMWVSKPLPLSSVCKNLRGQRHLGAEIWPSKKWVNISCVSSVVSGPKFTHFLSNVGEMVVDNAVFRLSISWCVLEIFATEVWSFRKSRRILDGLYPGYRTPNVVPRSM